MDAIPRSTLSAQDWFSYSAFWVSVWILRFFLFLWKKCHWNFDWNFFNTDWYSATSFNNATLPNAPKEWPTGSGLFKCSNAQDLWGHLLGVGYSSVQMPKTYGDISFKPLFLFFIFPLLLFLIPSISFPGPTLLFFQALCPFIPHFSFSSLSLSFFLVSTPLTTCALTYIHGYIYYKLDWHMR